MKPIPHSHDHDAERALIGAVLLDATVLDRVGLEPDYFTHGGHRRLWAAMLALHSQGKPIDEVLVSSDASVDLCVVAECALANPTAGNAEHYADILRRHTVTRQAVAALGEVLGEHKIGRLAEYELVDAALKRLTAIDVQKPKDHLSPKSLVKERFRELDAALAAADAGLSHVTGVPTGIQGLDDLLGGLQRGVVTIAAGRPGMGKSAFALGVADFASANGYGVHEFSLEDPRSAHTDRMLARSSGVPTERIRAARLQRGDMQHLIRGSRALIARNNWRYCDDAGMSAEEIVRAVRRYRTEIDTQLVIVDYLQLLRRPNRYETVHDAIGQNLDTLAVAAQNDGMAYLVLSQLSRRVEQREHKRPQLSDLRDSGKIEERAKCVLLLYRGAYYGEPKAPVDYNEPDDPRPTDAEWEKRIELVVGKNSNGRVGIVRAGWDGPTTRIY